MAAAAASTRDITEVQRYIQRDVPAGGGIIIDNDVSAEQYKRARHLLTEAKTVPFTDARSVPGGLASWELDTHGFKLITPPPPINNFKDRKLVREQYYPKLVELAKQHTGASEGYAFNHLIRDEDPQNVGIAYSRFAHTDASAASPPSWRLMLRDRFGVPEETAMSCDILMVNIWHPYDRPAYKDPLCLLDYTSLDWADISKIPYVDKDGNSAEAVRQTGLIQGVNNLVGPSYSPNHRWVYLPDMQLQEGVVFKQIDFRKNPKAKATFHCAIDDRFHNDWKECPNRRSIECRLILTYDPETPPPPSPKL